MRADLWGELPYDWHQEINAHQILAGIESATRANENFLRIMGLDSLEYGDGRPLPQKPWHPNAVGAVLSPRYGTGWYRMSPDQQQEVVKDLVGISYREWAPQKIWSQWKQVYVPHPLTTNALVGSGCDEVPGEILHRLPHPNPTFLFPWGIPITHSNGVPGTIRMISVCGAKSVRYGTDSGALGNHHRKSARLWCSTSEPGVNAFNVQVVSEYVEDEKVVDVNWGNIAVPVLEHFSLNSLVERTRQDFTTEMSKSHADEYMSTMITAAVSHLLYAVSANVDLTPVSRPQKVKSKHRFEKQPTYHAMGYRIGAQLGAYRERRERGVSVSGGSTLAPHLRRAHFHTYRVGRGRQDSRLNWLSPIPVNVEGDGLGDEVPVFHRYM